jgi:uncharacterized protein YecE (DUF72 family)
MHGRNSEGWNQSGSANWRAVRYLYDYQEDELTEWKDRIAFLQGLSETVGVIFNNNSGGHAAGNAKKLMTMLGIPSIDFPDRPPMVEQLDLFASD